MSPKLASTSSADHDYDTVVLFEKQFQGHSL